MLPSASTVRIDRLADAPELAHERRKIDAVPLPTRGERVAMVALPQLYQHRSEGIGFKLLYEGVVAIVDELLHTSRARSRPTPSKRTSARSAPARCSRPTRRAARRSGRRGSADCGGPDWVAVTGSYRRRTAPGDVAVPWRRA